jgi:hypothetical protein
MNTKRSALILIFLLLTGSVLISACRPAAIPEITPTPIDMETPIPATPPPLLSEAALRALAVELNIEVSHLVVMGVYEETWNNTCLGLPAQGEMCAQVITPGLSGIVNANGNQFEFRMDESGKNIRLLPGAALTTRQILSQKLKIDLSEIGIVNVEAFDWPDACLGLTMEGQACAAVITPGYKISMEADGDEYIYRTDEVGNIVLLEKAPETFIKDPIIVWEQDTEEGCESALIGDEQAAAGPCDLPKISARFVSAERASQLASFSQKFAPFEAETAAGVIRFYGKGEITAKREQKRMIAEWARLAAMETRAGHGDIAWGLAFTWRREGGLAGFCDEVNVYMTGEAVYLPCDSSLPASRFWLVPYQLQQLFDWIDTVEGFEEERADPAVADRMVIRIQFLGRGERQPEDWYINSMDSLAAEIAGRGQLEPDPTALQEAFQTLSMYLDHLSSGRFDQAAQLLDGDIEGLFIDSDHPRNDIAGLIKEQCTVRGYICLNLRKVVYADTITQDSFRFIIELENRDGSLFSFGPCCGADPEIEPPQTQFEFWVVNKNGKYLVHTPPLYVP